MSAHPTPQSGWHDVSGPVTISTPERTLDLLADRIAERVTGAGASSPWLTTRQAAERLRLSVDAVHRLTGADAIPHRKQGGRCLFHRAELDEWLDGHCSGPVAAGRVSKPFHGRQNAA